MTAIAILSCFILRWCLKRNNDQMDRQEAEDAEQMGEVAFDKDSTAPPVQKQVRYVL